MTDQSREYPDAVGVVASWMEVGANYACLHVFVVRVVASEIKVCAVSA